MTDDAWDDDDPTFPEIIPWQEPVNAQILPGPKGKNIFEPISPREKMVIDSLLNYHREQLARKELATVGESMAEGFHGRMRLWRLTDKESADLLNLPEDAIRSGAWYQLVGAEQIVRIADVTRALQFLELSFGAVEAAKWLRTEHHQPYLAGKVPLEVMTNGDIFTLMRMRAYTHYQYLKAYYKSRGITAEVGTREAPWFEVEAPPRLIDEPTPQ